MLKQINLSGHSCVLLQAVITEYHRLGVLNSNYLFFIVLEAEKSKVRTPVGVVSVEGHFLFYRSSHCVFTKQAGKGREEEGLPLVSFSSFKDMNPIHEDSVS